MRFLLMLSAFVLLMSTAFAKDEAQAITSCSELFGFVGLAERGDDTVIDDISDGCRITNFYVGTSDYQRYRVAALSVTAPGLFEAFAADLPPASAEIVATGIALAPRIDPVFEYLMEVQNQPFDAHLSYRWDDTAGTLELRDIGISSPLLGRLAFSATISGVGAEEFAEARTGMTPAIVLKAMEVTLDNGMVFESFVLPSLISLLPPDQDPRPAIALYQQQTLALLSGLPDSLIDKASKAAIAGFIESFPRPKGEYVVAVTSEAGIGFDDLEPLLSLLEQPGTITIRASHSQ